jgi:RNA polymerase sigma factor (sigma-70 family)
MSFPRNHIYTETDLIRGCIGGDRRYQEALYLQYSPKMYSICLRYCNNNNDAQDVLQDGFVKVFRNLDQFRGEGSFEGWMRRIFVNTAIEHFRKKINIATIPEAVENTFEDKDWTAFDRLGEKDILAAVRELSPGYRTIFNMYVVEGYSHKEIGEALGINEGTSKSQLARARVILQKVIEKFK